MWFQILSILLIHLSSSQNHYEQFCLNKKCSGDIIDDGDQFIHDRSQSYCISIFSLRNKFVESKFKINQMINLYSQNYLHKVGKSKNIFYMQTWVQCLDANSKKKMWNMAYRSREKFKIRVKSEEHFLLRLSDTRVEVLYDQEGMYGALINYNICQVSHMLTTYQHDQVMRDLKPSTCLTLFNPFLDQRKYIIICLPTKEFKEKFISLFRLYKSRCYPNIELVPKHSYLIRSHFAINHPVYQFALWLKPELDRLTGGGLHPVTFYLTSKKIFYQTYQYLFLYDTEPIELLFQHIISPSDTHQHCCHNIIKQYLEEGEYFEQQDKQKNDEKCVLIKKHDSLFKWRLCSYMQSHIDRFVDNLIYLIKMQLLINVEYPIMFSHEQKQFSINTAYDYLKGLTPDLDYQTCRKQRKEGDNEYEEEDQEEEEGREEDDQEEQEEEGIERNRNVELKKEAQFQDDGAKADFRNKYKVMKELLDLEDFSATVLRNSHLKGDLFAFVRDKLKLICKEKKKYKR